MSTLAAIDPSANKTSNWFSALVIGVIIIITFSPPVVFMIDSICAAFCLPVVCTVRGLTAFGLLIQTLVVVLFIRGYDWFRTGA